MAASEVAAVEQKVGEGTGHEDKDWGPHHL
jgi:hypothetical protein